MRLKKLEIFGFKSFADRTEILFDEGVTCVVGPNGCGKSNISDAIRWVLGERSARLLRGSKMEDVIFNGTDFRKPLAMAEVSLTIDNTDRGLPIDYQEVTLTRRLYRSGESEYLINRTVCRLKDIQDLILDTGIGSSSYSMIEQGRIDYILNADADERRFLIEEAAGISKYKTKKEEAIRKLERTEENRLRLNDIIQEVHKNIQYAERQAKRASRYKEQFELLKTLEIKKAFFDLNSLATQKNELGEKRLRLKSEMAELEIQLTQCQKEQDHLQGILRGILDRFSIEETKCHALQSKMEQNEQQLRFHQERRMENAARSGQIQQEQKQLRERILASESEISARKNEVAEILHQRENAEETLRNAEEKLKEIDLQMDRTKLLVDQIKQEAFQAASDATQIRNEYHRLVSFLDTHGEHRRKQDAGADRIKEEALQWEEKKQAYAAEIEQLTAKLESLTARKKALDDEVSRVNNRVETEKQNRVSLEKKLHEKQTRLQMLEEIDAEYQMSEETVLSQLTELERSMIQSMQNIFTVEPGYEWALEAALEVFSRSLIVEDIATAERILNLLRDKKIPSLGLMIRSAAETEPTHFDSELLAISESLTPLSEFIQIKSGFENLFHPFFRNVFVLESSMTPEIFKNLLSSSASAKFLARDGLVIGPQNRIFFRPGQTAAENNPFRRSAEIKALREEIQNLLHELEVNQSAVAMAHEQLQTITLERTEMEAERLDAVIQKESFESLLRGVADRLASFRREMELITFESQEMQSHHEKASLQRDQIAERLAQAEAREKEIRQQQENLTRGIDTLDYQKLDALRSSTETKSRVENIEERNLLLEKSLKLLLEHDSHDRSRLTALSEESIRLAEKNQQLLLEDEKILGDQAALDQSRRESEIALELIRREKESTEDDLNTLRNKAQGFLTRQTEFQEKLHQFEMKEMDFGYQEKGVSERLQQTYRIDLNEFRAEDFPMEQTDPEEFEKKISDLRERVESLGTVNLLAIEEYEELKTRYDFLITQQKDLDDARESLLETIRTINRTTKGLFEETFANVQRTFKEYYQTLFRGGDAKLVLIDESNPLESGIDIIVRPPGKKLTHITLLSGGEKALTAIALLFALFKIKPSPFCVLDEVDAPLDEANIDRFLAVLKTFLSSSQFIIVTHNRKTIAMGDSLYGVTMQEAGISKLVSVKVQAANGQAVNSAPQERGNTQVEEQVSA